MNCEKCDKEIDGSFGSGKFCSRVCANSRIFSEESRRKKSESNKKRITLYGRWGGFEKGVLTEALKEEIARKKAFFRKKLMDSNFDTLTWGSKRKRVIIEQKGLCLECGIGEWRGKHLSLEIDHKDGNHNNNKRENLVAICPNCHSLTPNWRGRNLGKNKGWLPGTEIYNLYKNGKSIRQILIEMGFAGKGGNYAKMHKIIDRFEIV